MKKSFYTAAFLIGIFLLIKFEVHSQSSKGLEKAVEQLTKKDVQAQDSLYALAAKSGDTLRPTYLLQLAEITNSKNNLLIGRYIVKYVDSLSATAISPFLKKRLLKCKAGGYEALANSYEEIEGPASHKLLICVDSLAVLYRLIDDEMGYCNAIVWKSGIYFKAGDNFSRLQLLKKELASANDKKVMARYTMQILLMFAEIGDTAQVRAYSEKAIQIEKGIGDASRLPRGYFLKGKSFGMLGKHKEAIEAYRTAISLYEKTGEKKALGDGYFAIGQEYQAEGDHENALKNYTKANELAEQFDDFKILYLTMLSIGEVYSLQGDHKKAMETHMNLLSLAESSKDEVPISMVKWELAKDHYRAGTYQKAAEYMAYCVRVSRKLGVAIDIMRREKQAYKIDSALKNFTGAFEHYQQYISLNEKVNAENLKKASEREKLDREMQKQELVYKQEEEKIEVLHAAEKQKQKNILMVVCGGLAIVLLLAIFIYRNYRLKQKANEELEKKNIEIAEQKHLIEEKQEEVMASIKYAKRIQMAQIPSEKMIAALLKKMRGTGGK